MKREQAVTQKARGKFVPPDDPLFKGRPRLAEAMCDAQWDDGSIREPWSLSTNYAAGYVLLQLNDREQDRSLSTTAETFEEGLRLLEELLQKPVLPWRYWKTKKKGNRG